MHLFLSSTVADKLWGIGGVQARQNMLLLQHFIYELTELSHFSPNTPDTLHQLCSLSPT